MKISKPQIISDHSIIVSKAPRNKFFYICKLKHLKIATTKIYETLLFQLIFRFLTELLLFKHTDIDECALKVARCAKNAACINTPGSYRCECQDGYQLNERHMCESKD